MRRALVLLSVAVALAGAPAAPAAAKVTRYLTGNAADVTLAVTGPAHDLGGGGTDVDQALQWMIDQVRGCTACSAKVDVVILRATGSDGYNAYIAAMNGVDSVETLVITSRRDADTTAVEATVRNAEVVFFAGGDQCDYVTLFKGTKVETAVEAVYARGGGVGGTSAGLAIQGDFTYDACKGSVTSAQALANPYHRSITFTYDLFHWANLATTITDSHFVTRDRMGRTLAFLARQIKDGRAASALALAIEEATSVVVDRNGLATVMGAGPAYFVLADHPPETCVVGTPLTYSNFKIWKVATGGTFDLRSRPTTGFYTRSVTNGVLSANPY
jgi:cyanophycinase